MNELLNLEKKTERKIMRVVNDRSVCVCFRIQIRKMNICCIFVDFISYQLPHIVCARALNSCYKLLFEEKMLF